jgi:peptide/nickel transport system substrate-binding protein
MRKPILCLLAFVLLFVLAACAAPEPTKPPAAPKATDAPKPTVAAPAPTTAPPADAPKRGGKITMAIWQSPTTLNPLLGSQDVMNEVLIHVLDGMLRQLPDGSFAPNLAKEVPTVQNGGVSADGKTITYNFKPGVLWSDGTPFTCDDFKFTWQARMTPGVGIISTTGYTEVETVECPNPTTAVVKYKNFYPAYLNLFDRILPKSAGDPKDMKNWAYNRKPIGTGPFKVQEWIADDHITLVRNENYREKDKPYLDQIVVRIVPNVDVGLQLIASGEVDMLWSIPIDNTPQMDKMPSVKYSSPPRDGGERIFFNMAENKDPADPTKPHMILGDVKVRQALALAVNKQRIIDQLLYGKVAPLPGELNNGYYNCTDIKQYPYDIAQAKKLLDEAGWVPGADGTRVSKGAKFAPDGTRLRLKYSTTSGDKLREDTQTLVMQDFKAVGVEAYIENAPSSVVIGTWEANSPRRHGNFDLIQYSTNVNPSDEPIGGLTNSFATASRPSEQNKGGQNVSRFSDPKVDALLKQAQSEPDQAKRKTIYCQIGQIVNDAYPAIYLYQAGRAYAYRDRLQGWIANGNNRMGWNAQDWWLK